MKLYSFFRSSASWRVRIALALKGLAHDFEGVHLRRDGGKQNSPAFKAMNPQKLVPVLEDNGEALIQSLSIIEYLDETHPEPPLLAHDPVLRAHIRAASQIIACDIHPLNNLRVLLYLENELGQDEAARTRWYRHWVMAGFEALEDMVSGEGGFCFDGRVTLADLCLTPQVFNAERFGADLSAYPKLAGINGHLLTLPAFADTAPGKQPDAE